jgi:hypothetical protein
MTLVAGFRCLDGGILMCADREESGDGTKRSVDKLWERRYDNAHFVIGASGTSVILANLFERLEEQLVRNASTLQNEHRKIIGGVLRSIHKDFREFKEWQEMVVAASFYRDVRTPVTSFLYGTVANALEPVPDYVCAGVGKAMAGYFCRELYERWPNRRSASVLAAFVFREVGNHVLGVGRGTDMIYMAVQQRLIHHIPHSDVKELEDAIPTLKEVLSERWGKGIRVPHWLAMELYNGENNLYEREL